MSDGLSQLFGMSGLITVNPVHDSKLSATHRGTVHIDFGGVNRTVKKTYLIPLVKLILLSCSRLDDYRISIKFEKGKCILSDRPSDNRVFGTLTKRDSEGLYTAQIKSMDNSCKANFTGNAVPDEKLGMYYIDFTDIL